MARCEDSTSGNRLSSAIFLSLSYINIHLFESFVQTVASHFLLLYHMKRLAFFFSVQLTCVLRTVSNIKKIELSETANYYCTV